MSTFGLLLVAVSVFSLFAYMTTKRNLENSQWVEHTYGVLDTANLVLGSLVDMETGLRGFLIGGTEEFLQPFQEGRTSYEQSIAQLKTLTSDNPEQVSRWEEIEKRVAEWKQQIAEPAIELRRAVNAETATFNELAAFAARPDGKRIFDGIRGIFIEATGAENVLLESRMADTEQSSQWLLRITLWGSFAIVGSGLLLSFWFSGSLAKPLEKTAKELAHASQSLGSVAGQVSASSQSLAEGSAQQAASVEETGASLEELSSMAKTNAENAQKARATAATARESAAAGAAQTQVLQSAMSAIEQAGQEITNILGTINDIAFQTNILALKASHRSAPRFPKWTASPKATQAAPKRRPRRPRSYIGRPRNRRRWFNGCCVSFEAPGKNPTVT